MVSHKKLSRMKNTVVKAGLFFVLLVITGSLFAQAPGGIYYQAVAKDNQGNPARNRTIHVRDAILRGSITAGTMVFEESHQVQTNSDGVFTIIIGYGTKTPASPLDSITKISWGNGPFFFNMKIAIAPSIPAPWWIPANNYIDMGTTQLMSVPYALYAANASVANVNTSITPGPPNTFLTTDSLGNVNWTTPQAAQVNITQVNNVNLSQTIGQDARIAPNSTTIVRVPVLGVKKGDPIWVTPLDDYANWSVYAAWASADGTVSIRFANFTALPVDVLGSQYKIVVVK
jgi:hypothetical protein